MKIQVVKRTTNVVIVLAAVVVLRIKDIKAEIKFNPTIVLK